MPITLNASVKSYEQEIVIKNTSGIPDEKSWDEYEKRRIALQLQQTREKNQKKTDGFNPCSCISYARFATGINIGTVGLARNHPVNSNLPVVGGLAISFESWMGHAMVVTRLDPTTFHIKEYNYVKCAYSERDLPYDYSLLKGFYK